MESTCWRKLEEQWGWIVVSAVFLTLFITVGMLRSSGMFYDEWMSYFEGESSAMISVLVILNSTITTFFGKSVVY